MDQRDICEGWIDYTQDAAVLHHWYVFCDKLVHMPAMTAEYQHELLESRCVLEVLPPNSSLFLVFEGDECGDHSGEYTVFVFPREYTFRVDDTWVILSCVSSMCYGME